MVRTAQHVVNESQQTLIFVLVVVPKTRLAQEIIVLAQEIIVVEQLLFAGSENLLRLGDTIPDSEAFEAPIQMIYYDHFSQRSFTDSWHSCNYTKMMRI